MQTQINQLVEDFTPPTEGGSNKVLLKWSSQFQMPKRHEILGKVIAKLMVKIPSLRVTYIAINQRQKISIDYEVLKRIYKEQPDVEETQKCEHLRLGMDGYKVPATKAVYFGLVHDGSFIGELVIGNLIIVEDFNPQLLNTIVFAFERRKTTIVLNVINSTHFAELSQERMDQITLKRFVDLADDDDDEEEESSEE